jgi:murein DD-endopeptidase MepM/ murein hydrolase activator NlpD
MRFIPVLTILFLSLPCIAQEEVVEHPVIQLDANALSEQPDIKKDCDNEGHICLTTYTYKEKIEIEAENIGPSVRTLNLNYFLNNMQATNDSFRKNIILKAGEKQKIETLTVIDPNYNYGFNYNFNSYFGIIDAVHDDSYEYDLPFEPAQEHLLLQGVGGKFSHTSEPAYYAYDFKMPIGTSVLAAREGTVVNVVQKYNEGGINPTLKNRSNYIRILHSDGTISEYNHLKQNGAMVKNGDYVQKGQKIGLSGNTGYTTNPHLHFSVFKVVRGGKYKSIPIKIKTSNGVSPRLKQGEFYKK